MAARRAASRRSFYEPNTGGKYTSVKAGKVTLPANANLAVTLKDRQFIGGNDGAFIEIVLDSNKN